MLPQERTAPPFKPLCGSCASQLSSFEDRPPIPLCEIFAIVVIERLKNALLLAVYVFEIVTVMDRMKMRMKRPAVAIAALARTYLRAPLAPIRIAV